MSLLVTGEVDRIQTREAGTPGNTWTERTIVVIGRGITYFCTVVRDFRGDLPESGDHVALDVFVRSYVKKDGTAGHGFAALGRNVDAERTLFAQGSLSVAV